MQICKEKISQYGGGGTPLPESPKLLDMLGENLEILWIYKGKKSSFHQNVFQLMCEKK